MPKIVDHDAYRRELADRAAALFSRHGYQGLGMRRIAEELGVSKSALYHYFPTKAALFDACTQRVTEGIAEATAQLRDQLAGAGADARIAALEPIYEEMAAVFASELSLLVDYLRERPPDLVASDPSMVLANRRYEDLFAAVAGETLGGAVYALVLGTLLRAHFDGGRTTFASIGPALRQLLS